MECRLHGNYASNFIFILRLYAAEWISSLRNDRAAGLVQGPFRGDRSLRVLAADYYTPQTSLRVRAREDARCSTQNCDADATPGFAETLESHARLWGQRLKNPHQEAHWEALALPFGAGRDVRRN